MTIRDAGAQPLAVPMAAGLTLIAPVPCYCRGIDYRAKASLKHSEKRLSYVPSLKHKTRDSVSSERTFRLSIETLAEMLDFTIEGAGNYAGHADRLLPFRRYVIAAISTVARPDAIFDMSVQPAREQWLRDHKSTC